MDGVSKARTLRTYCPELDLTIRLDEFCQVLCHLFNPWQPLIFLKTANTTWWIDHSGLPEPSIQMRLENCNAAADLPEVTRLDTELWGCGYRHDIGQWQFSLWLYHASELDWQKEQQLSLEHLVLAISESLVDALPALAKISCCWRTESTEQLTALVQQPHLLRRQQGLWQLSALNGAHAVTLAEPVTAWIEALFAQSADVAVARVAAGEQSLFQLSLLRMPGELLLLAGQDLSLLLKQRLIVQQQAFYQGALDCGLTGLIALNLQGEPVFINQKARELLHLNVAVTAAANFSHLHFYDLQEEIPELTELHSLFRKYSVKKQCHCMVQYPDESTRVLEFRWNLAQDKRRHDISVYCLCSDMTHEYQLRQTLHHIEHHLDHLLHYSPVVLYQQFNGNYHGFVYVSPNAERILGYSAGQILANPDLFVSRVHPDDSAMLANPGNSAEYRFWSASEQCYIWLKDIREKDPENVGGVYGALTNVTARKNSELEKVRLIADLEEQKKLVTATVNSLLDGVITIEQHGTILDGNPTVTKMLGYSREELIGCNVSMLMPEPDASAHDGYLARYMAGGDARIVGIGRKVKARHKDGHLIPVHLSVTELPMDKDNMRRFVGCLHDLTETELQQQQLIQSSKLSAIGTLTSGIAHDFNNVLGIMRGYAELLSTSGQPAVEKPALAIIKAADRAGYMIKNLLEFSTNKQRENQLLEVGRLLQDIKPMLTEACGARIRLQLELPAKPCWLELEKGGLENAFLNLVINAKHAMEGAGDIHLRCRIEKPDSRWLGKERAVAGEYLHIEVQDTGCGMTEQVKARIFEPFFSTKGAHGTGLGLAQVFGFIRRSHGILQVDSAPGLGATFSLYFPLMPALQQKNLPKQNKSDATAGTILVVDDEAELLELHATMLELAGFQVLKANNGTDALKMLHDNVVDALITDVVMPGLNGLELAKRARQLQQGLPIQLISGFADESMVSDEIGKELFAQRLNKPVQTSKLVARVQHLIGKEG